ncbi:MAG: hypothetical protein V2J55_19485 [Candidatus Competibacteraceae bacterium]|jgi:hypothetical protein|nr:hypothetical protein [Candidatus Competibacteraceae bacterium]
MPVSIDQFRSAATKLGDDSTIDLRTDQQGVATSKWQRFKVWVGDFVSKDATVAERQKQTVRTFLASVKASYGQDLADIASDQVYDNLKGGPLTGKLIRTTLAAIEERGGQHWLQNERLIREFAHTVMPPSEKSAPSLSSVVNPITEAIVNEAVSKGLSQKDAAEFLQRYTTGSSQIGVGFTMPRVSHAIEVALRKAMVVRDQQGVVQGRYRRLDPQEAREIAKQAVRQTILSSVNQRMGSNYLKQHPFQAAFDKKCEQMGLSAYLKHMDLGPVEETFTFAMQDAKGVVGTDKMPDMVDKVLTRYFTRQREKLDQIEALKLPEGNAKDQLIAESLGTRSRMSPDYFVQLQKTATQFAQLKTQLDKTSDLDGQIALATEMGRSLLKAAQEAGVEGADDVMRFMSQAFLIYASKAPKQDVEALVSWVGSDNGQQVAERMADYLTDPEAFGDASLQQVGSLFLRATTVVDTLSKQL